MQGIALPFRNGVLLAAALTAAAAGCAGRNVTRMSRNLVGGQHPTTGNLALNIEKTGQGDSARYELFVHWSGLIRINLKAKESLIITADRQRMVFSAADKDAYDDMRCEGGPCTYDDRAYYPATPDQLRAIAAANQVLVEVVGSRRTIEREFNEDNFDRFREFIAKHLPTNG